MKAILSLEYVGGLLLGILLFADLHLAWWIYPVLFLAPDISMIGYLINTRVGAVTYNLFHHLLTAVAVYGLGHIISNVPLELTGSILIGHLFFDRLLGYGLKFPDSFKNTHLGTLK